MIKFQKKTYGNFYLLDDTSKLYNEETIIRYIEKYNYDVVKLEISKSVKYLSEIASEFAKKEYCFVSLGKGGEILAKLLHGMKDVINTINLEYSQIIIHNRVISYKTDLDRYDWKNKKIVILEDVIYTGDTLYNFIRRVKDHGGNPCAVLTCIACDDCNIKLESISPHIDITSYYMISKDNGVLPPLYSYRHLLYGEGEWCEFFDYIGDLYFSGNKNLKNIIVSGTQIP